MDREEFHVYKRHMWPNVEIFYRHMKFPGSKGRDVGSQVSKDNELGGKGMVTEQCP